MEHGNKMRLFELIFFAFLFAHLTNKATMHGARDIIELSSQSLESTILSHFIDHGPKPYSTGIPINPLEKHRNVLTTLTIDQLHSTRRIANSKNLR
jgi:hypothetical protein